MSADVQQYGLPSEDEVADPHRSAVLSSARSAAAFMLKSVSHFIVWTVIILASLEVYAYLNPLPVQLPSSDQPIPFSPFGPPPSAVQPTTRSVVATVCGKDSTGGIYTIYLNPLYDVDVSSKEFWSFGIGDTYELSISTSGDHYTWSLKSFRKSNKQLTCNTVTPPAPLVPAPAPTPSARIV